MVNQIKKQSGNATLGLLGAIIALLLIGMALGTVYLKKKHGQEMDHLHQYVAKVEGELGAKNIAVREFQIGLAKISADSQSQDVILTDHIRLLEDALIREAESNKKNGSTDEWLLSEVEFLLKLADNRIAMKQDVKGAVALMKSAEELIKKMPVEDEGLLTVRVTIAKEIAALEAYRTLDVPGTFAELVTLGETIEKLPLLPVKKTGAEAATTAIVDAGKPSKGEPKFLSEVDESQAAYVTIRKHDDSELDALLSPDQRLNLRDGIRLALQEAQTGLLQGDQKRYDDNLAKVRQWVGSSFAADNIRVQISTQKLDELAKVSVSNDIPNIVESQQELMRYVTDRMRVTTP